jgi:hypothetical protein
MKREAFVLLRRARYFSFACPKEKYPRENDTPLPRFPGILPGKSACGLRGLSTAHPWTDAKLVRIHANHPAGFPPPARRCRGAPGRATRILRVLFRKARSRAEQQHNSAGAVPRSGSCICFCALQLFTECGPRWPAALPGAPVRQAGWPSLLVTFLLATQEKSDSRAEGARKLCSSKRYGTPQELNLTPISGTSWRGLPSM